MKNINSEIDKSLSALNENATRKVAAEKAVIDTNKQFAELHKRLDAQEQKQAKSDRFNRIMLIAAVALALLSLIATILF